MHKRNPYAEDRTLERSESDGDFIDLESLVAIGLRRMRIVALFALAGLVLGGLYLLFTPSVYTAATRILLDEDLARFTQEETPVASSTQMDSHILSQVEILKSSQLARSVVLAEKLQDNEAFLDPPSSPIGWAKQHVKSAVKAILPAEPATGGKSDADEARIGKATALLQQAVSADRLGRSLVLELTLKANDPALAGSLARAYADKYLEDQLDANFDATQRAMIWLQGRLDDLRRSSNEAATAVEEYRAKQGLTTASGELVSDQQLSDLNSQLILAQAETANARARYEKFRSLVENRGEDAVMNVTIPSDQPNSAQMSDLKARYLNIVSRERDIAERYGEDHPQAVRLQKERDELEDRIFRELEQLTATYRTEYEVARSREESLRANVGTLRGESAQSGQAMVKLRELEQKSTALSNLYQTYLGRYEEASQQRSLPIAKARVISEAENPVAPSSPREAVVLALSLALGLFAGAGAAAFQEFRERFFRTGGDVEGTLGLKFLGYLPLLSKSDLKPAQKPAQTPGEDKDVDVVTPPMLRFALDAPGSAFAETLRNARLSADLVMHQPGCKVIGFVSVLPGEGKTTVAANFACLLAANGAKTLLVDGDLRNPGLSRGLVADARKGLVDAVMDPSRWRQAVRVDRGIKLAILPALKGRVAHTSELLSGPRMGHLIDEAREVFDYIVVDLPPLGPVIDAKAFEPYADGFVLVSEWGATPRALVRSTLESEPAIAAKVLGTVLNKTDMKHLARYAALDGSEKYRDRYDAYYTGKPAKRPGA